MDKSIVKSEDIGHGEDTHSASMESMTNLLQKLDDYTPAIPDAVMNEYLKKSGLNVSDPKKVRVLALATQKFISDIANDTMQQCKIRTSAQNTKGGKVPKDRRYNLTLEDLVPVLNEHGITVRKPPYFV